MASFSYRTMDCCGLNEVAEATGVNNTIDSDTSKTIVEALLNRDRGLGARVVSYGDCLAHYIFTSNGDKSHEYMQKVARAIAEYNLGSTWTSEPNKNPNTSRLIRVMVWTPNKPRVKELVAELSK